MMRFGVGHGGLRGCLLALCLWALLGKLADLLARGLERALLPWQPRAQRLGVE